MDEKKIDTEKMVDEMSKAFINLQQLLDDYYYWVCKLEVDPKNVGTTHRYRPRKGWTWEQCSKLVDSMPKGGTLDSLKQSIHNSKTQEGEISHV